MAGLVPAICASTVGDGRDKPGHDREATAAAIFRHRDAGAAGWPTLCALCLFAFFVLTRGAAAWNGGDGCAPDIDAGAACTTASTQRH
jgi:hypothetical protein